jgi:hypothetical protein
MKDQMAHGIAFFVFLGCFLQYNAIKPLWAAGLLLFSVDVNWAGPAALFTAFAAYFITLVILLRTL